MLFYQIVHESIGLLGPPDTQEQTEQFKVCQSAVCICRTQYWFYIIITLSNAVYKLIITITKLSNVIGYRVWLIVAGRVSRIQSRGRGSNVAVAGSMSRSRVQSRGRGSNVAAGENDLGFKVTEWKWLIWTQYKGKKIFFMHYTLR